MGLYLKLKRNNDLYNILKLYDLLLENLKISFEFTVSKDDTFKLIENKTYERLVWEGEDFEKDIVLGVIKKDIKDVIGQKSYTLTGDGVINLKTDNGLGGMVIDINAFYLNTEYKLYGDVYINFYNSNIKWEDYFFRRKLHCIENFNLIGVIGNSLREKFNLKYIFLGTYDDFKKNLL